MRRIPVLLASLAIWTLSSLPANADRPIYSQIEQICLPNGETGELRIVETSTSDGLIIRRPLVVNKDGRLVARGRKAMSLSASCVDGACAIVDLGPKLALDLDEDSFREGPLQPRVAVGEEAEDWDLADGEESWGFSTRGASLDEIVEANLSQLGAKPAGFFVVVAVTALGAFFIVPLRLDMPSKWRRRTVKAVLSTIGLLVSVAFFAIGHLIGLLAGLSAELWLIAAFVGAAPVWLAAFLIKRSSRPRLQDGT